MVQHFAFFEMLGFQDSTKILFKLALNIATIFTTVGHRSNHLLILALIRPASLHHQ